jgi:hypothetical protein
MGRPRLDDGFSLDKLRTDIYTTFLLDRYPLTKVTVWREECPALFAKYSDSVMVLDIRIIDLYRSLSQRMQSFEKQVDMWVRAGHDIMAINRWILEREAEGWPEDVILHRVAGIIKSGLACKRCFERGRISELVERDDGWECLSCSRKYGGAENFLEKEFKEWLRGFEESGTPLKVGRLLIFPPRLKNGLLAPP